MNIFQYRKKTQRFFLYANVYVCVCVIYLSGSGFFA